MRLRLWWTFVLCLLLLPILGASTDNYPGRILAMYAFRLDMGWSGMIHDTARVKAAYEAACDAKSSNACRYEAWVGPEGGSLPKAVDTVGSRCPSEPQACVVVGFANSRDEKGNLRSDNPMLPVAVDAFKKACGLTYPPGCAHLGELYLLGAGVPADANQAARLFDEACDAKDPWGCYLRATMIEEGKPGSPDPAAAKPIYEAACKENIPHACVRLGIILEKEGQSSASVYQSACDGGYAGGCSALGLAYQNGKGVTADPKKAESLFKLACDAGDMAGCTGLAGFLEEKGDQAGAAVIYERTCATGDAHACGLIGKLYLKGQGVKEDKKKGLELITRACNLGDGDGCDALGQAYEAGSGVSPDMTRAASLYAKSCEAQSGRGCFHLAKLHQTGKGVPQDARKAGSLLEKACALGHGKSCSMLAEAYMTGNGVTADPAKGIVLLKQGCEAGEGDNCALLGQTYEEGKLAPKDLIAALGYYERGCSKDSGKACVGAGLMYEKGIGVSPSYPLAAKRYTKACKNGAEQGCVALNTIAFPARFEEILAQAFSSDQCQVWSVSQENPDDNRQLATFKKDRIQVLAGPRKGDYAAGKPTSRYEQNGMVRTGISTWTVGEGKNALGIEHLEAWNPAEGPVTDFPGANAYSKDPMGDQALVFNRDEFTLERKGETKKATCSFPGGVTSLSAENCSEIQALIAGQLLSECK